MSHVVLLGDSIFDNAQYVPGGPAVIDQIKAALPEGWQATLLAVDGAMTRDVSRQLAKLPKDTTHLVLSAGGNDALMNSWVLNAKGLTAAQGFATLAKIQKEFRESYEKMLHEVLQRHYHLTLCSIYDSVPGLHPEAVTALAGFNDVILREAVLHKLPLLDLRVLCDEARDYSDVSPIEPSVIGGEKIVSRIVRILTGHNFHRDGSVIYGK